MCPVWAPDSPQARYYDPPHGNRHTGLRPVSGLALEAHRLPGRGSSGVGDEPFSVYRCGGSTGLAAKPFTWFPFIRCGRKRQRHL